MSENNCSTDLQHWNPMEDDYLSKRNIYKIDDEDAGLALEGYSKSVFLLAHCLLSFIYLPL